MKKSIYASLLLVAFVFLFGNILTAQSFLPINETIAIVNEQIQLSENQISETDTSTPAFSKLDTELHSFFAFKESIGHNEPHDVAIMKAVIAFSGYTVSEEQYDQDDFQDPAVGDWKQHLLDLFSTDSN